jgi:Mg-chelatase subunit ChlD
VVDDNADFGSYLAFRSRTQVAHRARDVRERHLLEVKDARGRPVGDAEVAVRAASGHATWARTDTGGRAWLHPDAFDPARSSHYDVLVRKEGRQSASVLRRGQKSTVEVVLDAAVPAARARLDLVFLVDATGSMADEIDKLKATLRTITAEVAGLPSRPDICLGLVAYRDRGDAFLLRSHDFTNDVGAFLQQALQPLQAGGGGDYPEAMNEALHETVHQLSWRGSGATRMVILLADAPPHLDYGAPHYDDDMLAALGKGIKVFGVGASGLDRQGEFIQRQIAQYTGGKFVFLTYAQAHNPASGPGRETMHDVKDYSVDTLDRLVVRLVTEELAKDAGRGG